MKGIPLEPNSIGKESTRHDEKRTEAWVHGVRSWTDADHTLSGTGGKSPRCRSATRLSFKVPPHAAVCDLILDSAECAVLRGACDRQQLGESLHGFCQRRRDCDLLCDAVQRIVRRAACRHLLSGEPTDNRDTTCGRGQTVSATSFFERRDGPAIRSYRAPRSYGRPNGSFEPGVSEAWISIAARPATGSRSVCKLAQGSFETGYIHSAEDGDYGGASPWSSQSLRRSGR